MSEAPGKDAIATEFKNKILQGLPDFVKTEKGVAERMPPVESSQKWAQYVLRTISGPRFFLVSIQEKI